VMQYNWIHFGFLKCQKIFFFFFFFFDDLCYVFVVVQVDSKIYIVIFSFSVISSVLGNNCFEITSTVPVHDSKTKIYVRRYHQSNTENCRSPRGHHGSKPQQRQCKTVRFSFLNGNTARCLEHRGHRNIY
jgi:hypothetical protein